MRMRANKKNCLKKGGNRFNQNFTCSRAIWNHVFATMLKRFAWFVCVVLTAKNTSSNWMAVGFGVTVPASIVIRLLNDFVVTSFIHGNCVGVKFRWNPGKWPFVCCDLGASTIWNQNEPNEKNGKTMRLFCYYFCYVLTSILGLALLLYCLVFSIVDWMMNNLWLLRRRLHPLVALLQQTVSTQSSIQESYGHKLCLLVWNGNHVDDWNFHRFDSYHQWSRIRMNLCHKISLLLNLN